MSSLIAHPDVVSLNLNCLSLRASSKGVVPLSPVHRPAASLVHKSFERAPDTCSPITTAGCIMTTPRLHALRYKTAATMPLLRRSQSNLTSVRDAPPGFGPEIPDDHDQSQPFCTNLSSRWTAPSTHLSRPLLFPRSPQRQYSRASGLSELLSQLSKQELGIAIKSD